MGGGGIANAEFIRISEEYKGRHNPIRTNIHESTILLSGGRGIYMIRRADHCVRLHTGYVSDGKVTEWRSSTRVITDDAIVLRSVLETLIEPHPDCTAGGDCPVEGHPDSVHNPSSYPGVLA